MKFLTFFVAILSTSVFIACEFVRPLPSKDIHDQSLSSRQLAQSALADLADTAAELAFVDLVNAASELSETLAIDDGTSVEPMFSKLTKLADAATILEHAFTQEGCKEEWCIGEYQIGLHTLSKTSVSAVKAYTIRDADQ